MMSSGNKWLDRAFSLLVLVAVFVLPLIMFWDML